MYRLKIEQDQSPENPRTDWDNADIMFCKHGRYNLGDEDAEDPMEKVYAATLTSPAGTRYVLESETDEDGYERTSLPAQTWEGVIDMLEEHRNAAHDEAEATPCADEGPEDQAAYDAAAKRAQAAYDYVRKAELESEYREREGIAICRPLFLYDHGGITISAGSFGCPWDSGQVGWQYVTDEALAKEWDGDRDAAMRYMDATLQTYDDYLTGNVHGYIVEKGTPGTTTFADGATETTIRWEHADSCWGFYGDWHGKDDPSGLRDDLINAVLPLFDSLTWSAEGEWHYTDDVPEELQCD